MAKVETDILSRSNTKPLVSKRFLDDIFVSREEIVSSLSKLINTTPQLDLRRKYLKQKRRSCILRYTKAKDLKKIQYLICARTLNLLNFPIYAFHLMSPTWRKKRFEKGEALRLFRTNSSKELFEEKTEKTSKKNSSMGVIQKFFFYREHFQKLRTGNKPSKRSVKKTNASCLL